MQLENLETGERSRCHRARPRLDLLPGRPDALAQGSMAVRGAIERGVELVIINKFGAGSVVAPACATKWLRRSWPAYPCSRRWRALPPEWKEFHRRRGRCSNHADAIPAWWSAPRADLRYGLLPLAAAARRIAPRSPRPGMPHGKPAGMRCAR